MTRRYQSGDRVTVRSALGGKTAKATVITHEGSRVHVRCDDTGAVRDVSYTRCDLIEQAARV